MFNDDIEVIFYTGSGFTVGNGLTVIWISREKCLQI
jgi:hypothetical protein